MATKSKPVKLTLRKQVPDAPDNRSWYRDFIAQLSEVPNVSQACAYAGVARQTAYEAREVDARFRQAWDDCINASIDHLEEVAFQRAKDGSDVLAIFLLKAHRPERYQERGRVELTGADGGPLELSVVDQILRAADDAIVVEPKAITDGEE